MRKLVIAVAVAVAVGGERFGRHFGPIEKTRVGRRFEAGEQALLVAVDEQLE